MSQLLDLSLILTLPPQGSPPNVIASITLRCDTLGLSHFGDLLHDPLTPQERSDLRWYLEEYWKWPYLEFAARGKEVEALLMDVGKRLYHAVFGTSEAQTLVQKWQEHPRAHHQISIVSELPRVLNLPWELLHDEQVFLTPRSDHPISLVRRLPQPEQPVLSASFEPPLRVLLVTARPKDAGFIDPRSIARELLDELQPHIDADTIELEFLRPPTRAALHARLQETQRPIHVLHFDGHGAFKEQVKQGLLAFENDQCKRDWVPAANLAQILQNSGVRFVILTACQSAHSAIDDPFSSVAARLLQGGIDAVVAMSASFLVRSATRYVEAFYRAIATDTSVPIAQEQARHALYDDPRRHVLYRRRDEEGAPIELRDWWVPHFYQQRPISLQWVKTQHTSAKPQKASSIRRFSEEMPPEPRYGFSGRARELLQIERLLWRGKLVVISGFGGVGKTTLVREAADWLTRTGMYEGACFVSFEHGGDATTVLLSTLGNYLDINDDLYNPNDLIEAPERLKTVLQGRQVLVILDSLESLLPGRNAQLEGKAWNELYAVLLKLKRINIGVLLTSRGKVFEVRPSNVVMHLPLQGLDAEDAYVFAIGVLKDRKIELTRAPYLELRDLLAQLGYHPLAMQLVLPRLENIPLATIRSDFSKLLKEFADDRPVEGRNASLEASLEYSLQGLSTEQRVWLSRLALFEGGAREADLLVITEIAEDAWMALRSVLEQSALLTVERIHKAISAPYLRFHPVLAPYLRTRLDADDAVLRHRYIQRYYALVNYLYEEDISNPQPARALVKWDLPNLRRAVELLREEGNVEGASLMAERIIKFLNNFGFWRERDALRRLVEASKAGGVQGADARGTLTRTEYLRERGKGDDEYRRRNVRVAYECFTGLLVRIEALPDGAPLGRGSFEHCQTLHRMARCLNKMGHLTAAEERLREARAIIDTLLEKDPDNQGLIRERGVLLGDLGDVLLGQGRYHQAQEMFEEALKVDEQLGDVRGQAANLAQLGTLNLVQQNFAEAKKCYKEALDFFGRKGLNEPEMEATAQHLLGVALQKQGEFIEAEKCYRRSLEIKEFIGNTKSAASTCNQLAILAEKVGHLREAEGWYGRALKLLEFKEQRGRNTAASPEQATIFNNLADLLLNEVQSDPAAKERLIEARNYAGQALAIREKLDASENLWDTLHLIAEIEVLAGRTEQARDYRQRERESFAAFPGNRYHIYQDHERLIAAVVAAAKGSELELAMVEKVLPSLEEKGWYVTSAIQRIWVGERDWYALTKDLDAQSALLVKLMLETLAQSTEAQDGIPEQEMPLAIYQVFEQGAATPFERAFADLSQEELLRYRQALKEK